MNIEILDYKIAKGDYDISNDIPIDMSESEKTVYGNEWCNYQEQNTNMENNRGQAYSLILGQYTQLLQDTIKQDTAWNTTSTSYNPIVLV